MEHLNVSYKEYHENYIVNERGTSMLDVSLLLVTTVIFGFHDFYLKFYYWHRSLVVYFISDIVVFVLPCVFLVTILNAYVHHCLCLFASTTIAAIIYEFYVRRSSVSLRKILDSKLVEQRRPFVTYFKAVVTLLSVICILAVDFTIFPIKYAKTETFGYSLMDTGVGFFVVSNGLSMNTKRLAHIVKKSFISNSPLLILGVIRYISVEKIHYQKQVTEYGVHWNFFFTLALVKYIGSLVIAKIPNNTLKVALTLMAAHQMMLSSGLENWVLGETPRTDLLSANREGIVSLLGYLSLYLAAVRLGQFALHSGQILTIREELYNCFKLLATSAGLFTVTSIVDDYLPSSRRLANPTFVSWMFSLCLLLIGLAMVLEVIVITICQKRYAISIHDRSVLILESISLNNLLFFLVCNLLTGAVNLTFQTLFIPPFYSVLILILYITIASGFITVLHVKKWNLKYW